VNLLGGEKEGATNPGLNAYLIDGRGKGRRDKKKKEKEKETKGKIGNTCGGNVKYVYMLGDALWSKDDSKIA